MIEGATSPKFPQLRWVWESHDHLESFSRRINHLSHQELLLLLVVVSYDYYSCGRVIYTLQFVFSRCKEKSWLAFWKKLYTISSIFVFFKLELAMNLERACPFLRNKTPAAITIVIVLILWISLGIVDMLILLGLSFPEHWHSSSFIYVIFHFSRSIF